MSTIKVRCTDQVLAFENTPVISSGGIGEDFVSFSFCGEWDGFAKTAVFWLSEAEPYHVLLDSENSCEVPHETTGADGIVFFGVIGVDSSGNRRTSNVLSYRIVKGAITDDSVLPSPSVDVYEQMLTQYAEISAMYANKMDKATDAVPGNFATFDADGDPADSGKSPADFASVAIGSEEPVAGTLWFKSGDGELTPDSESDVLIVSKDKVGNIDVLYPKTKAALVEGLTELLDGFAALDDDGKVPADQLPSMDYVPNSDKGQADGVATLDAEGKVPADQLPSMDYVPNSTKGQANGVATLDAEGKVPESQLRTVSNDPFDWRSVEVVPVTDFANYQSFAGNQTKLFALPVAIDFSKYKYEFEIKVYGLNEYNNTETVKTNYVAGFYLADQYGNQGEEDFAQLDNSEEGAKRSSHLPWPHVLSAVGRTDDSNRFFYEKSGMEYGDQVSSEHKHNTDYVNTLYPFLMVNYKNNYTIETFGIVFSYRAYAAK